jgi:hypothetical protein
MKQIKIKNKLISYTEQIESNEYTIKFSYTKPANAHNDAQKMDGVLTFFVTKEKDTRHSGHVLKLAGWGRLFVNGKHISTHDTIITNTNGQPGLSVWTNDYNYSFSNITKADAYLLSDIIRKITSDSEIFTIENLTPRADTYDMIQALNEAFSDVKELKRKLIEVEEKKAETIARYQLTNAEAETMLTLYTDGLPVDTLRETVRQLLA